MAKHELPHEVQRQARRARLRQSLPIAVPIFLAAAFLETTDTPAYVRPLLVVFGGILPLLLIDAAAASLARVIAERRARRGSTPWPRTIYVLMALAWLVAGTAFALLARAPGAGADAIAPGPVWATMISVCAALMMALRAATAAAGQRPWWLGRLRAAR
jgi:hypothetical protein